MLAARASALCAEILSAGVRKSAEWVVGSVANERGTSMAVHLTGPKAGVWMDFASGEAGDALDLVAAVLYRGDKKRAYGWALRWLGLANGDVAATQRAYVPERAPDEAAEAEATKKRNSALALWLEAEASLAGTPAEAYLLRRHIDLTRLGRQPRALRFHPACWCAEANRKLPALVAAVSTLIDGKQVHIATHRTWLDHTRGVWHKARVDNPKKTLAKPRGGTIRLWRGESGLALADAPPGETLCIGEGIETCLSVALACPQYRVLCSVSLANMASIDLPLTIGPIIILADNDGENPAAAWGLQRVCNVLLERGHDVRIARSPVGKDFNDALVKLPAPKVKTSGGMVHA